MPATRNERLAALRGALERRPEILEAYLFGSFARGQEQPHSDVDVAVYLASLPTEGLGADAEIAADLMRALGFDRVDVVVLNTAPPLLYHRVLRNVLVLGYLEVDLDRLHRVLNEHLDDFVAFASHGERGLEVPEAKP